MSDGTMESVLDALNAYVENQITEALSNLSLSDVGSSSDWEDVATNIINTSEFEDAVKYLVNPDDEKWDEERVSDIEDDMQDLRSDIDQSMSNSSSAQDDIDRILADIETLKSKNKELQEIINRPNWFARQWQKFNQGLNKFLHTKP